MVAIYYDGLPCEYENEEVKYKGYVLYQKCNTCKQQKTIQIKKRNDRVVDRVDRVGLGIIDRVEGIIITGLIYS